MSRYYMACLNVAGRECLVVGGGTTGTEKARGLLECGARVTVVAPEIDSALLDLPVEWQRGRYASWDLDGKWLVVTATPYRDVNLAVHEDAERYGIFCNVADEPDLCSFILPAVHRDGPIAVAVSTSGTSPALAQRLRAEVAGAVRPEHAALARELEALRPWVREHLLTDEERRDFFARLVEEAFE